MLAVSFVGDRLRIDEARFRENERQFAFEIGNNVLSANLLLQAHFGLRAEPFQVFLLIILATVQRLMRNIDAAPDLSKTAPVPAELRGGISRRQIAAILGIPLETVRRHIVLLIEMGLVEERSRGRLSTRGGTLQSLSDAGIPLHLGKKSVHLINVMIRKGAV